MQTKGDKKRAAEHSCGLYCPCGKMSTAHLIVKIFLALAMIGFGLVIAITIFYNVCGGRGIKPACDRMHGGQVFQAKFMGGESGGMIAVGTNMAFRAGNDVSVMPERVFGSITKIEANQITIKNNAAQEQVVISQADTVIFSSSTEVGLSALQIGQNIIVYGTPDKDNKMTAKMINIQ
jgi:hypothetical protein